MFTEHMRLAIREAEQNRSPFGAVLAMGDQVLVSVSDAKPDQNDPVGHAILVALRELGAMTHETQFPGHALYTTVEPCPLCASACVLTRLEAVHFGVRQKELKESRYPGKTRVKDIFNAAENPPILKEGILEAECRELL